MNRETLLAYAIKYDGNYKSIYKAIRNEEKYEPVEYSGQYLTFLDDDYPKCLLQLKSPPLVLFYKGDISLLKTNMVSMVGSRNISDYGKEVTLKIANIVNRKATLVSGMPKGVDYQVHSSCLYHGHTIGVLGCGIDYIYPRENFFLYEEMEKSQLLITEFPAKIKPYKYNFPFRNRIIAALGEFLIVTQANMQSGTFLTVNEAIELNKDVYVVPYPLGEERSGCNQLIQEGAELILDYKQVFHLIKRFDTYKQ